ncbi:MAG: DUF6174 domain-containing protein [Gemmatimonadota bacterium]
MRLRAPAVILAAALTACGVFESGPADDIAERRRAWARLGISDYSFDYVRSCFCGGPAGDTLRIQVRGDSVVSVENLGPRKVEIDEPYYSMWVITIDGLFAELERAVANDADEIDIDFDPQYSFPRHVNIDFIERAIDDEMSFRITRFQPNP